jgi:hypothetical protein
MLTLTPAPQRHPPFLLPLFHSRLRRFLAPSAFRPCPDLQSRQVALPRRPYRPHGPRKGASVDRLEDDEKRVKEAAKGLKGLGIESSGIDATGSEEDVLREAVRVAMLKAEQQEKARVQVEKVEEKSTRPKVPSTALMGCSMLGSTFYLPSAPPILSCADTEIVSQTSTRCTNTPTSTASSSTRA